jgi:hypothetical protein
MENKDIPERLENALVEKTRHGCVRTIQSVRMGANYKQMPE